MKKRASGRKSPKPKKVGKTRRWPWIVAAVVLVSAVLWWLCRGRLWEDDTDRVTEERVTLLTTGYCNCEQCCSWQRNEKGEPVYAYGPMKGKRKVIGLTSTGRQAHAGTIAADPKRFAPGTTIIVPGYGRGTVEDIGGAIKGDHLDLWFPTHEEARRWGRRTLTVTVLRD